jgi:hypothetical protein
LATLQNPWKKPWFQRACVGFTQGKKSSILYYSYPQSHTTRNLPESSDHDIMAQDRVARQLHKLLTIEERERERFFIKKTGWMNVFKSSGSDAILCHVQMSPGHSIICTNSSFPLWI